MITLICPKCRSHTAINDSFFDVYEEVECNFCGTLLSVVDILPDMKKVDSNLISMFNRLGIEATIEFIDNNQDMPYAGYYIQVLKIKGLHK